LVPWIEMIANDGTPIWQTTIPMDGGDLLSSSPDLEQACGNLVVFKDGTIAWAVSAIPRRLRNKDGKDYLDSNFPNFGFFARRVLVEFDANGAEIKRVHENKANGGFLFDDDDGLLLVEHSSSGRAIRAIRYDRNLKILARNTLTDSKLLSRLTAVIPDAGKGYFLAGCGEHSSESVVHIDDDGATSSAGVGFGSCSYSMEFASTVDPDGPILLVPSDFKIVRFSLPRYQ